MNSISASDVSLQRRVVRSTLTNVGLSFLLKILLFAQSIILARVFAPADLGLFTTASMAVSLIGLFGQIGADQAIIRNQNRENDKVMADTALTVNLIIGSILFVICFLAAPLISGWLKQPGASVYIRFLSFLFFQSTLLVPSVLWFKNFNFGMLKIPHFCDLITSLGTTLLLFYVLDFGIWSLFYGKIAGFIGNYASLWTLAPYRPRLRLNREVARSLIQFGWPLMINGLCNYLVWQGDQWLIVYFWGKEQLAYYVLAFSLPFYLKELVDMVSATLFPFFSRLQGENGKMVNAFASSNKYLSTLTIPIGVALVIFGPQLIHHIYTDKWSASIPFLQLFAVATMLSVVMGYNWGLLVLVSGRTKYLMYVNLWIIFLLGTIGVFMVRQFGPIGGCLFMLIQIALTSLLFRFPIIYRELRSLSFLRGIWKPLIAGGISGWVTHTAIVPAIHSLPFLMGGVLVFSLFYLFLLALFDWKIIQETKYLSKIAFSFRR
jgi:PST family polysaccharide transporter